MSGCVLFEHTLRIDFTDWLMVLPVPSYDTVGPASASPDYLSIYAETIRKDKEKGAGRVGARHLRPIAVVKNNTIRYDAVGMKSTTLESPFIRKISIIGAIGVLTLATILSFIATGNGLVIEGDGYYYINVARIFAAHLGWWGPPGLDAGLLKEITAYYAYARELWPPFYPALLAAVSFSADPYAAGRWLQLLFPAVIGVLVWWLLYRNRKTHARAFVAVALILLSPTILRLNAHVYSETTFLILQVLTMLAVSDYAWTGRRCWLAAAVIFIALGGLTRYIGVVMAPALALTLWRMQPERPVYRRLVSGFGCILMGVLPVAIYLFSSVIFGKTLYVAGRSLSMSWPAARALQFFQKSLRSPVSYLSPEWWPWPVQTVFALSLAIVAVVLFVREAKRQRRQPPPEPVAHLRFFIKSCLLIYLVLASLLALYLDHMVCFTGLTPRHFAPLFIWSVVLFMLTGPTGRPSGGRNTGRFQSVAALVLVVVLISGSLVGSAVNAVAYRRMVENADRRWENSPALVYMKQHVETPWIVSNLPGEVFHYLRTPVFALPSHYDFFKAQENPRYGRQMTTLKRLLHRHQGVVLYFDLRNYLPKEVVARSTGLEECLKTLGLEVYLRRGDCFFLRPVSLGS